MPAPEQTAVEDEQAANDYPGENPDNRRMWYLWKLLSPVVFLIARAPLECCLFVLVVGLNIISNFFYQYNIEYHYTVIILPGLFFATTMAITRIKRVRWRRTAIVGVVASCLWTGYLWGPSPLSARPSPWSTDRAPWVAEGRALLRQVPPNVPISVFYGYVPHIAHRVEVYQFPVPWRDSYYRLPGDETAQIRPLRDQGLRTGGSAGDGPPLPASWPRRIPRWCRAGHRSSDSDHDCGRFAGPHDSTGCLRATDRHRIAGARERGFRRCGGPRRDPARDRGDDAVNRRPPPRGCSTLGVSVR